MPLDRINLGQRLSPSAADARETAIEAYIFGYPLVLMEVTRRTLTNVSSPRETGAPMNQLCNRRTFPEPSTNTVVSPNADTLYSFGFLDVSVEPIVLSVPDMGNRYYLMQLMDAWSNVFAAPGTRTTGNGKGDFAIAGPGWSGTLAAPLQQLQSPTALVWMVGRTQTNGKHDYSAVRAIQDQYKLTPLSSFGKRYMPPRNVPVDLHVDTTNPPPDQVSTMAAQTFFARMNFLMKTNPPAQDDLPLIRRIARIDIGPGHKFDLHTRDLSWVRAVEGGAIEAQVRIISEARKEHGETRNGWQFVTNVGRYGTDYLWRAVVAYIGFGANLPEDAVYARATMDAGRKPLHGSARYEIRFEKSQLPPVRAFWSITLYNEKQSFVPNILNRYAIGDRDHLVFNPDGSLSIYVQNQSPGRDRQSNWLPAPRGIFNLCLRLYWPKQEILNGSWSPPPIERKQAEVTRIA
ncbi:MAG TPA: DUF1254 domain-containing protein [Candidatus Angelobacter sp.]|jgi:hypothetical protein|nr:DUF1254 domain-containing protein [Candidatus Angelobacter sp.]